MRNVIFLMVAGVFIAGVGSRFADQMSTATVAKPAERATPRQSAAGANMMVVPSDRSGHFRVNAVVGGRSLSFLVDTGATIIALTKRDADRLGLNPSPRDVSLISTANGTVRAMKVRLASVDVGPLTVSDVTAVVMPPGALGENLLGMSFLSRLRRFEFRTGQLVMEQ